MDPRTAGVDMKRLSIISSALEKRKIAFDGKEGSDPNRFLMLLEESRRALGISEQEMFAVLPTVLADQALEWFRLENQLTTLV